MAVESFTTRGIRHTCDRLFYDRVNDAYGALEFLTTLGFVDSRRVALMGSPLAGSLCCRPSSSAPRKRL
ncbi:hypothetical protein [Mesorhizobium sp.]|uniref:hypothetical protein n=1 Tax=Mesorhizobium sp. TaxID=1871066 RepID=UPI00257ACBAD|nr:hypothetical protein [Mesorhizobium sp.]